MRRIRIYRLLHVLSHDCLLRMTYITGLAVNHDDAPMVESFVMRGADVDGYDRDGNTALLRAGYSLKHACVHKRVHHAHFHCITIAQLHTRASDMGVG